MLKIRFFLARSSTCISLVIFRTTASDSVAFSRMRDICPRRSYKIDAGGRVLVLALVCTVKNKGEETYRNHLLYELHSTGVLVSTQLLPEYIYFGLQVSLLLSETCLHGLKLTQSSLCKAV